MTKRTGHKGPGRSAISPAAIATAERHAEWLDKASKGWSIRKIAADAGVAPNAVWEAVTKAVRRIRDEPAEAYLTQELLALDGMIDATLDLFDSADTFEQKVAAIAELRKNRGERRKFLGLDAPTKTMDVTPPPEELWASVKLWLQDPSPDLVRVLEEAGWRRVVETTGEER